MRRRKVATYTHMTNTIDPSLVPKVGMSFKNDIAAKEFFSIYAKEVGFPVKLENSKTHLRIIHCNREGVYEYFKGDENLRTRNRTTMKTNCKAKLKLKCLFDSNKVEVCVVIEQAHLKHNHRFSKSNMETTQMACHKQKDSEILEFVDEMHVRGVPNHCINNMTREIHGGTKNLPMTFRDLESRKAHNKRVELENDICSYKKDGGRKEFRGKRTE